MSFKPAVGFSLSFLTIGVALFLVDVTIFCGVTFFFELDFLLVALLFATFVVVTCDAEGVAATAVKGCKLSKPKPATNPTFNTGGHKADLIERNNGNR